MSFRDFLAIATSGLRPAQHLLADEPASDEDVAEKLARAEQAPCEPCDLRFVLSL
jgi:hypothetical protein